MNLAIVEVERNTKNVVWQRMINYVAK